MTWDHPAQPPRILMQNGKWDPAVPPEVRKRLLGRPEPVVTDKGISFSKVSKAEFERRQAARTRGGRFR